MADIRYRPFSCGTQFIDFQAANCCRCTKHSDDASKCEIDNALLFAQFGDGSVSADIAERMGYLDNCPPRQEGFSYNYPCGEVDWTPEWVAEVNAREGERLTAALPGLEVVNG